MSDQSPFSHRLRLRVCGLLVEGNTVLLVKLRSPVIDEMVWTPPGGEVEYGESLEDSLKREFREEVQIEIQPHALLHVNELIKDPFHAVELYFEVSRKGNKEPEIGFDPELEEGDQLIKDIEWVPMGEVANRNIVPPSLLPMLIDWPNRSTAVTFSK